jgi:hypothetical protein
MQTVNATLGIADGDQWKRTSVAAHSANAAVNIQAQS